jgi:hypothetical protein
MLKNYTVIVKNVLIEKRENLLKYLNDEKHKNHTKKETEIFEFSNRDEFEKLTNDKLKMNKENYKKNKKGGRKLKRVAKSFTFNLPKNYKNIASIEKCKEIDLKLKKAIISIYKNFNVEINENELYSVLHHQDNPHIHLIIPYLDKEGSTIRNINHKGFTNRLKILFSQIVDNILNTDINNYQKLNKEDNSQNRVRQALEEIKEWYETLIRIDGVETKYYKNQIINIERRLKDTQEITQEQLLKINDNMQKASTLRIKNNKTTPKTPFL